MSEVHPERSDPDSQDKRPKRRQPPPSLIRGLLAGAIGGVILAGSVTLNVGLVTLEPGPVTDATELVRIEGATTYKPEGSYLITTVGVHDASLARSLWGWASPDVRVVPRDAIYPPDKTTEEIQREHASQMDESQYTATIAAFRELGFSMEPNGALVLRTLTDTAAAATLLAGDIIIAVEGEPTSTTDELTEVVASRGPPTVEVTYFRGDEKREGPVGVDDDGNLVGVEVGQSLARPFDVVFEVGGIGGPSAGLTFALTIVDLLTEEDLTGGKLVADTGTINAEGIIGPIGGISQKVAAAEEAGAAVFLVPAENHEDAKAAAPESMSVIAVSTLREALDALRGLK